jgi:ABC-type glycerol-3-phosphate transport system substrate-binding protein
VQSVRKANFPDTVKTGERGIVLSPHRYHGVCPAVVLIVLVLLIFHSTVSAGSAGQREKTELRFWHSIGGYNKEVLASLIDTYNQSQKQVIVKGIFQGSIEDLYLKLVSQENVPDIILAPIQILPLLQKKGLLANLDSLVPDSLKKDIARKYWDSVSIDNSIYGIPFSYTTDTFFVNQHLLRISGSRDEKEPASWKGILPITRRIRENIDGKQGIFIPMESVFDFVSFVKSYTGKSPLVHGTLMLDSPETIDAVRFLQDLVFSHKYMPQKTTMSDAQQLFLSGNLGILMSSSDLLVYIKSNLPYDLTLWHLPSVDNTPPTVTGMCLALPENSRQRKNDAFSFLEYLMSYESILKWHTHTGTPAIRTSVKDSIDLLVFYENNPNYTTATIDMERGEIFNPDFNYFTVNAVVKNALDKIFINGEDPAVVLAQAQKELEQLPRDGSQ